jgi:hypothetical protein
MSGLPPKSLVRVGAEVADGGDMPHMPSQQAQWWLAFLLFGAIVLAFVIAALAMDPLTASVP